MWSNETATATTGGPRVIDVFYGNGRHRAQIIYFLWMQIGPRTPSGIGPGSGSRLRRMRRCLELSRELDRKLWQIMVQSAKGLAYMYAPMEAAAHALKAIARV